MAFCKVVVDDGRMGERGGIGSAERTRKRSQWERELRMGCHQRRGPLDCPDGMQPSYDSWTYRLGKSLKFYLEEHLAKISDLQ